MSKLCFFYLSRTLAQQKKHCLTCFAGINFFNASLFMDDDDDDDDDDNDVMIIMMMMNINCEMQEKIFYEPVIKCTVTSLNYTDMAQLKGFDW